MNSLNAGYCRNFSALEHSALDSDGKTFTEKSKYETLIRVFNQDYINEHIDFERQSSDVIHYSVVGNGEIKNAIAEDEAKVKALDSKIEDMQKELAQKQATKSKNFSEIAKTISQAGALVRSYNKTNAETAFEKLTGKMLMKEDELKQLSIAVSQPIMAELSPISLEVSNFKIEESISQANELLKTTVSSVVIDRLKDNPDISSWVEQGLTLYHEHKNEVCEFCRKK